jgi:hypothetical protein
MENDYNKQDREAVFSKRVRAGKRTYFFDVRTTRANDYYLTITESTKRPGEERFVKHKIFLYKEDFKKFMDGLNESTGYIREQLPDYDFDNPPQREYIDHGNGGTDGNTHHDTSGDNNDNHGN